MVAPWRFRNERGSDSQRNERSSNENRAFSRLGMKVPISRNASFSLSLSLSLSLFLEKEGT